MAYGLKIRGLAKDDIGAFSAPQSPNSACFSSAPRLAGAAPTGCDGPCDVREPAVFLFDEPLSNLDAKLRVQMRFEIQKLHRRLSTTSLYVTHDQVEAMTLAQRMIVMNAGRAEQIGTPMEVYENPATVFVAGFIGSSAMNFIDGASEGGGRVMLHGGGTLAVNADVAAGRRVTVGIRPEHLTPCNPSAANLVGSIEMVEALGADTLIHASPAAR
jgi:sn-glycerol 3-phosphate transport system ATP-binding protein